MDTGNMLYLALLNATLLFLLGRSTVGLVISLFGVSSILIFGVGHIGTISLGVAMLIWTWKSSDLWLLRTKDLIWWTLLWGYGISLYYMVIGIGSVYNLYTLTELVWLAVFLTLVRYGNRLLIQVGIVLSIFNLGIYVLASWILLLYHPAEMAYLGLDVLMDTALWNLLLLLKVYSYPVLLLFLGLYSTGTWWLLIWVVPSGCGLVISLLGCVLPYTSYLPWLGLLLLGLGLFSLIWILESSYDVYSFIVVNHNSNGGGTLLWGVVWKDTTLLLGYLMCATYLTSFNLLMYILCGASLLWSPPVVWLLMATVWWRLAGFPPSVLSIYKGLILGGIRYISIWGGSIWGVVKCSQVYWTFQMIRNTTSCILFLIKVLLLVFLRGVVHRVCLSTTPWWCRKGGRYGGVWGGPRMAKYTF